MTKVKTRARQYEEDRENHPVWGILSKTADNSQVVTQWFLPLNGWASNAFLKENQEGLPKRYLRDCSWVKTEFFKPPLSKKFLDSLPIFEDIFDLLDQLADAEW
mmetsp:Transcript_46951/g.117651  ORF Transcript_46951/g.117651 Transcript_46951/m.117651 type:complete len:104 (-) Transcript_46951:73-384(-)